MKTNIFGYILAFSAGGAIGVTVARKLLEEKYERIAQEKIKSIKEAYTVKRPVEDEVEEEPKAEESNELEEHETIVRDYTSNDPSQPVQQYTDYTMVTKPVEFVDDDEPYVIEPMQAGDDDYELMTYTLYGDGVLADEMNLPVEDIIGTVGADYASHFNDDECNDDTVYIRNDRLKTDFEILREGRTYAELMTRGSHIGEDN